MTPYLAVIRDSFHAALASRVLWIAFLAIWLLLAALAPIGYREDFTTSFRAQDFHNGTRMKAMLAQGIVDPESQAKPIGRIAASMPDELSRQLRRVGEGDEVRIRLSVLADALNECLDEEDWYDQEAWRNTLRLKELRTLDEVADVDMDESTRRRRARLRIEAAMPGVFETRSSRSIILTYAGMDFPANLAVDKTQFVTLINQWVVPVIIDWLLGFVLVFLGILVTASVIPDMLQPGSLHLLLSKPVSRSMLLLSKFVGGCAFVFLCVVQLVVGLYLVAGLRLDVWNLRFLWCIPVSVFLFSVFYSVSVVAGLRWRSPILAIGVTTIFGTICLVVGIIGGLFDGLVSRPDRIRGIAVAGETVFGATRGGGLVRYDNSNNEWTEVFESSAMSQDRVLSPVALDDGTVITARVRGGRFNPFGSGALDLLVLNESDDWSPEPSLRLPAATSRLFASGDSVIAMNTGELAITDQSSILEAAGQRVDEEETEQEANKEPEEGGWLSKLSNMMGGVTSGFQSILPPRMAITPPRGVVVDVDGNGLVAMSRGRLVRLEKPVDDASEATWSMSAERMMDGEASIEGVIASSGSVLMVARDEGPLQLLDSKNLELLAEVTLPSRLVPTGAAGLGAERFALVTSDGRCRIVSPLNAERTRFNLSAPKGASEVEAVHLDRDAGVVYLAHHVDRIDVLDPSDFSVQKQIRPSLKRWRLIDKFVISPLRFVVPQTGELGETIAAMVSGKSAISFDDGSGEEELQRYNIARPVASCAIFVCVMLTIGCLYFSTRDF
ncbi:MAG: ABC transporter permease [Rubripirellula sp.]